MAVLNIASNTTLNSIFTLEKLSAFGFWRDNITYHGCGKIHLEYCDNDDDCVESFEDTSTEKRKLAKRAL